MESRDITENSQRNSSKLSSILKSCLFTASQFAILGTGISLLSYYLVNVEDIPINGHIEYVYHNTVAPMTMFFSTLGAMTYNKFRCG